MTVPVAFVGFNGGAGESAPDAIVTFTTIRDIQIGERVIVACGTGGGVIALTSVSVGSLSLVKDKAFAATHNVELWSAVATSLISTGATVTATWASATNFKAATCISLNASVVGPSAQAAPGTTPYEAGPVVSATTSVVIGAICSNVGSGWTPGTGFTEADEESMSGTYAVQIEYNEAPSTSQKALWTNTAGVNCSAIVVSYDQLVTLDNANPDADVTTTGWTATPLFSKVNDASDATVIQATAS